MINIDLVHQKIKKKIEDDKNRKDKGLLFEENDGDEKEFFFKPKRIEDYVLPNFNIVESKAPGAETKRRLKLSKILTFVKSIQRRRYKDGCTELPIATTSRANCWLWGSVKNVSNALKHMTEIGLIEVHNNNIRFRAANEKENLSRTYKYFVENEKKFIQYCKDNGIESYVPKCPKAVKVSKKVKSSCDTVVDPNDVRFSSKLKLIKPKDVSVIDFEKYLECCLEQNYINFRFIKDKVDEINERFYKDDTYFAIKFRTHYEWDEDFTYVKSIGIRATNSYCNLKKDVREKLLDEMGFNLKKDVKSSVPRLTLSLNCGYWIDEDIDIYKLINDELYPGEECTEERREAIKALHMSAYFDEGSDKYLGKNVYFRMDKDGVDKKEIDELMSKLKEVITKVEGGNLFGNEIFYVESCIYLMTLYDLLCSYHKKVWLVYDSFYSIGEEDEEDYIHMIKEGIRLNFNEFMEKVLGIEVKKSSGKNLN